jgi:hypothetical protein
MPLMPSDPIPQASQNPFRAERDQRAQLIDAYHKATGERPSLLMVGTTAGPRPIHIFAVKLRLALQILDKLAKLSGARTEPGGIDLGLSPPQEAQMLRRYEDGSHPSRRLGKDKAQNQMNPSSP